jgi:hypothetical protein
MKTKPKVRKPAKKGCKCIQQIDKELAKYNTCLETELVINFKDGTYRVALPLPTAKINPKLKGSKKTVFGSFCPVCGKPVDKTMRKDDGK